jgi:hypothetical protein
LIKSKEFKDFDSLRSRSWDVVNGGEAKEADLIAGGKEQAFSSEKEGCQEGQG